MTISDKSKVEEISARLRAATEGRWFAETDADGFTFVTLGPGTLRTIAEVQPSNRNRSADAEFIAHSVDDVTWLLERLRATS